MKRFFIALIFFHLGVFLLAQPQFVPPVNIPIVLNGSFGEIRSNHFHTGIDIRTNGEIGLPVFSIDDGFISRISVSSGGFGNALYVEHPLGYTSVYGHLDRFSPEVDQWVGEQQYKKKSFEVNLFPGNDQFKVEKGQEIAKSGNSGASAGPHLHFEIRHTKNENPVNPLFFGFEVNDKTKPVVENLYVYPLSDNSHVMEATQREQFKLVFYGGSYRLKGIQSINVFGKIGFGVDAIDYFDNNWSRCGIYQMEYWVDEKLINSFEIDELDFAKNRYVNSHIDYELYQLTRKGVHKTFIEPGNKLEIYRQTYNGGLFDFDDGKRHKIQIILYDVKMNSSEIIFYVNSTMPVKHPDLNPTAQFNYHTDNRFSNNEINLYIPVNALYTDINFEYKMGNVPPAAYSMLHRVHSQLTPLHLPVELKIKTTNLPSRLTSKALIAQFDIKTGKYSAYGGVYSGGWIKTETRSFGDYCVVVDTIAPIIRPLSINNGALNETNRIRFKISDNLSGIEKYNGTIDGKWVLFEYDAKREMLTYNFDEKLKYGKTHKIELRVEDQKGNINTYESSFYY